MFGEGLIDQRQMNAALEIREVQDGLSMLFFRGGLDEYLPGASWRSAPLLALGADLFRKWQHNFYPWRLWADKTRYRGRTMNEIVTAVVVDSIPCPDELLPALLSALELYADIAERKTS